MKARPYMYMHLPYTKAPHWLQDTNKNTADWTTLGESERAHEQVYNGEQHHEGKFSHEFAAGAASFAAMKAYEDHQKKSGTLPLIYSLICTVHPSN